MNPGTAPSPFDSAGFDDIGTPPDSPHDAPVWLLELVAAVDHLGRGPRLGLTVWEALEEAVRGYTANTVALGDGWDPALAELAWDDPDPLGTALVHLLTRVHGSIDRHLQAAIRRWVTAQAITANAGYAWPHPLPRTRPTGPPDPATAQAAVDALLAQLEPPDHP